MSSSKPFVTDIEAIRKRAREHMERGAITDAYGADRDQVVEVLNSALATELVCVLRYKSHALLAEGMNAEGVIAEFEEHAAEEQEHADRIAERITQLGGVPNLDPRGLAERAHSEYRVTTNLRDMIKEDLIAERIAIETYSEIVRWLGEKDPVTRKMMVEILETEEEHADDMASLLGQMQ